MSDGVGVEKLRFEIRDREAPDMTLLTQQTTLASSLIKGRLLGQQTKTNMKTHRNGP